MTTDEAAIGEDLESRGSSSYASAPKTYLIALSRKINVDIKLITQLLSMIDKRANWLSDSYTLCVANIIEESDIPFSFEYSIYDQNLRKVNAFDIWGEDARKWLFPRFNTEDVPLPETRIQQLVQYFDITDYDKSQFFADIAGKKAPKQEDWIEETMKFSFYRLIPKGVPILIGDHEWLVRHIVFRPVTKEYEYDLFRFYQKLTDREKKEIATDVQEGKRFHRKLLSSNTMINEKVREFSEKIEPSQEDRKTFQEDMNPHKS